MPDFVANGKALLLADTVPVTGLVAIATGGIWDWDATGRLGINRSNAATTTAYSGGIIKPCLLLKMRTDLPFGAVADDAEQVTGARAMLEVWAYQDNGYATIKSMLNKVYSLWQGKRLGGYVCRWAGDFELPHDTDMDANVTRADYAVTYLRT